jgi:signal transduction histidine kinase
MENQLQIALSRNKLLKNADISKIDLKNVKGKLITIGEGEILYREGDIADIIFLVVSGEINVLKKRLLGKTKSYIFVENDFFGHEEFFEETTRTSTAVALRDSYLISLTREEVDTLIHHEDEVYVNLREPVMEIDDEILNQKEEDIKTTPTEKVEDPHWAPPFEEKIFIKEEPASTDKQNLPDISSGTFEEEKNIESDFDEPHKIIDGTKEEPIIEDKISFDESAFLNEDGIPKAEYEIPEPQSKPQAASTKTEEDFNDALFQILSGTQETHVDKPQIEESSSLQESDNAFLSLFDFKESAVDESTFIPKQEAISEDIIKQEEHIPEQTASVQESEKNIEPIINGTSSPTYSESKYLLNLKGKERKEIEPLERTPVQSIQPESPQIEVDKQQTPVQDSGDMNVNELQMIIKAAELVNSDIRVDEVLKNIVDVATNITSADRGTLYLIDKEKDELWSLITMGDETREIRLKIGDGLAGFVAKSGETINIKDVRKDTRFNPDFDKASGYTTKSMICFPIKNSKSQIIGVLQLLNSVNNEFSKRDEEFLAALSIHAAMALQNSELVEKLLQVERIQSLGKMANFLIQDIKKPILVSKRYAEHLRSKQLSPDTLQVVNMLLEQLTQVADLVQTTSSYSEGKTILRALNVSLNNTLSDYYSRIEQYAASCNCQIQTEYDKDVNIKLDVKEFYQCYMHIIKNACDAMPEGGKILVTTKRINKNVEIRIQDNGFGIPDGIKEKIFEPFMTYGKKEGTGLGLSITKKLIEALNGTIRVESSIGEGASFIITLPVVNVF